MDHEQEQILNLLLNLLAIAMAIISIVLII